MRQNRQKRQKNQKRQKRQKSQKSWLSWNHNVVAPKSEIHEKMKLVENEKSYDVVYVLSFLVVYHLL